MSASSVYSLASTQEDDVASIELGATTAASYNTEDELLASNWAALTPPLAYEDDVSEKASAVTHSPAHHHDEEEETVEVSRRDTTRLSIGEEFTARVHELLLHESHAAIKAERALECNDDEEEKAARVDSEEEGVETALEIGVPTAPAPATRRPLPATPRRGNATAPSSYTLRGAALPQPPTPRPPSVRGMRGLAPPPPPPPFFAGPGSPHHRSMYNGFSHPAGPFGMLGYGGPSMRPFNSLVPGGPLPPHLSAGGLGRPLPHHHHLVPPRAYMGGGPPASLGASSGRGRGHFPVPAPHHHMHHPHPPPPPPSRQPALSPPSSVVAAERRATATTTSTGRDSESSPRGAFSTSTSSVSPRTEPRQAYGRMNQSSISRDHHHLQSPPTMAALGIGHASVSRVASVAAVAAAAAELTPYPLVYVSPAGSISCVLNHDVVVEMAVDRSVRVVLHDNFAAFCNARGTTSAILHPTARILHTEEYVYTKFIANNEKMAVFGEQGVLFTMSHLSEAYLVNSAAYPGASAVALDQLQFPTMDDDYTIKMFYTEAQTGQQFIALCKDIVGEATYDRRPDGSLYLHINGMLIRQSTAGDVIIDARPRQISCSPSKKSVHVRSGCIDMAVEEDERGYVKRAHKRVHVSRSGMVISDGNCITSMDHFGRIVCCN